MATKQLIETGIWKDHWFLTLSKDKKLFFIYLITAPDINPSGIYELDTVYIIHGLGIKNYKTLLKGLAPKIIYDEKNELIWIVNYFFKNSRGPKIKKAVENALIKYKKSFLVENFVAAYENETFQIDNIQYPYSIALTRIEHNENDSDNEHENDNENEERASFDFEALYQLYPKKLGKTKGLEYCVKNIKTIAEYQNLEKAIDNYTQHVIVERIENRFVQYFSSFMRTWKDWIYVEKNTRPLADWEKEALEKERQEG